MMQWSTSKFNESLARQAFIPPHPNPLPHAARGGEVGWSFLSLVISPIGWSILKIKKPDPIIKTRESFYIGYFNQTLKILKTNQYIYALQCGGSVSFWYGSGSRIWKNVLRIRIQGELWNGSGNKGLSTRKIFKWWKMLITHVLWVYTTLQSLFNK